MTFELEPKCTICNQRHSPLQDCGASAMARPAGWIEPIDNTSRPYDFLPGFQQGGFSDPIMRQWVCDVQPQNGFAAQTGLQAMHVLASLNHHLAQKGDAEGLQLLARIWRFNNPVLEHLTFGQKRATEMGEGLQKIGDLLELHVGDDVAKLAPEKLRQVVADAKLLRGIVEICEKPLEQMSIWQGSEEDSGTAFVVLSMGTEKQVTFVARGVRGALQLAVDGDKEVKRNG